MSVLTLEQTKLKILVVDDKPENLRLLSNALSHEKYEVKCVINGEMALMVANSVTPDLILLDVMMPDLNGYQVCEKLKADEKTKDIPIIFLSANNDSIDRIKALRVGAVDYINKPFQINEVLLRIKNQLQLKAARQEISKLNTELERRIQERTAQLEAANQELKYEIKEREQVTRLLRQSEEKLESILNSLEEVVWSAEVATSNLLFLNPAATKVYGRSVEELLKNPDLRLESIHPDDRDRVELSLASFLNHNNELEYRIVQPNGKIRWVWERSRIIYDDDGSLNRRDGIICDITERKKIEEELSYEARHDSLTNLPNRSAFIEQVEQTLKCCHKNPDYLFAVLFIDLDRFKIVNDSLGHLVGDKLLISIAEILTDCSRFGDFVARLGGDEFTILLSNVESLEDCHNIAERIQAKLKTPLSLEGHTVFTSASIGIVLGNNKYQDSSEILRDADIAMYRAKSDGKARHEVFDAQMYAETKELLEIENDLRNAVLHKEFVLYYQPIVSLENDTLYGFEALLRWNHQKKGMIYPDKFIHVAEETGLIESIGRWALETACRQLRIWQVQYPGAANLKVGVNVASQQMKDSQFLSILDRTLEQTGLSGKALHLEITESTLMDYEPETISLFNKIRHRGIKINIDDFGTGYSSLQYLNRFPISTLKIDRSFTEGMLQEKENFEIIKTIVTLARTLKIDVVAEGIENIKQLKVLKKLNCKFGQGYLFSEAVDCESATLLINKY
ncbi:EAL domain-containing protein [Waterburya agarophytonicola K14]|uniref:EAL domain-containing protein n=1 Tax=Waterburya agarophytonicola KI4 TaxID=2874699 RepID=A0A964BRX1_9CYAN|nr:GGDEF domain-containing response regulator [Waterburya agarophytonicola]MCC0177711.1 EAL domain-containing protein [Waterburya agarophytonicola KI4]